MSVLDGALLALTQFPLIVAAVALPRILQTTHRKRIVLHALFPLSQAAFIGLQMLYAIHNDDWTYAAVLVCCSFICAIIGTTLVRHLVAAQMREEETNRVRLLEVQTEAQRRRMEELRQESIGVRDDYRRFLARLDRLDDDLRRGSDEHHAQIAIHDAADALCAHTTRFCDNLAVDALLSMKMQEAQRNGIDLHCDAQVGKVTPLSDVELCAVFANLCDNALHACERIGTAGADESAGTCESDCAAEGCGAYDASAAESTVNSEAAEGTINAKAADVRRPWIRVRARIDESHCIVNVTNSCAMGTRGRFHQGGHFHLGERFDSGGRFRRRSIPEHGWGLQILDSIAAKHGGTFSSARVRDRWLALFSC